jgi:thiol-disulfide isomerase/thioredoxin
MNDFRAIRNTVGLICAAIAITQLAQAQINAPKTSATSPVASAAAAGAAPAIAIGAAMSLKGPTRFSGDFDLASLKGKPVLVMVWNTDCLVCKSKMEPLRQAALAKNIAVVLVSRDKSQKTLNDYLDIVTKISLAGIDAQVHLWSGASAYADNFGGLSDKLPLTFLLDKQGKLVERVEGRFDDGLIGRAAKL